MGQIQSHSKPLPPTKEWTSLFSPHHRDVSALEHCIAFGGTLFFMSKDVLPPGRQPANHMNLSVVARSLYQVDEEPYPGKRFLRLAEAVIAQHGTSDGAKALQIIMRDTALHEYEVPERARLQIALE